MSQAHRVLRTATAARHAATDELFSGFDLTNPDDYGAFLTAQAAAVLPVEQWIAETPIEAALPDWPARRRGHLLLRDLAELGADEPGWERAPIPGDVLGAVYVLEGSRFGGRLLARRCCAARSATQFLRDPGEPDSWRDLWRAVDREIAGGRRDLSAMVEAAAATYTLFCQGAARELRQLAVRRSNGCGSMMARGQPEGDRFAPRGRKP